MVIVKNRAMGDAIIGLGAVQYARKLFPHAHLSYMVPAWVAPLFSKVETAADQIVPLNLTSLDGVLDAWSDLLALKPDCVHELFQAGRSSKLFYTHAALRGSRYTFHNHHHKRPGIVINQGVIAPIIQRDLDGIYSYYADRTQNARPHFLDYAPVMTPRQVLYPKRRMILGAVATRQTKMCPLPLLVQMGQLAAQGGRFEEVVVPLSPSKVDQQIAAQVRALDPQGLLKIVSIPLMDLPKYFASSQIYVGNDTGLKHLAVATGMKSVTLFGPEPPPEWHPYATDRHFYFYREPLECRTRTAHYCGLSTCDSMICLNEFTPRQVYEKALALVTC